MSLLAVGARCAACNLVDFLPFTCPGCAQPFCRDHVQTHDCPSPPERGGVSRKRQRGTCAYAACEEETIESVGGREGAADDNIAREVRCVCGGAYCVAHRSQEAHGCVAPRALSARQDAAAARRERAQEVMARHFPSQAGKERLVVPKQVDRTRRGSPPPSASSTSPAPSAPSASSAPPASSTPPASPSTDTQAAPPARTADERVYKMHQTKTRSLARPLDAKVPREESAAVEFVVDEGGARVRSWLEGGKYAPTAAGAAMGAGKPERIWVPHVMPGGKLFDTLVARAKASRSGAPLAVLVVSLRPGARAAAQLDLTRPAGEQVASGDVLVLVRGWE